MSNRKEYILGTVSDLVADFLYYDRKEDQELPRGAIEAAIAAGETSAAEIAGKFAAELYKGLSHEP